MKNQSLTIFFCLIATLWNSCKKDPLLTGAYFSFGIQLQYVDQQGVSLFSPNRLQPNRSDVDVTFIIDGKPVNFYSIKETLEHGYVPFTFNEETSIKTLNLSLNHYTDDKSTTIIKLKGYPADTLYGEFYSEPHIKILTKCTLNGGRTYSSEEVITLVK